jgi:hypothetical protein
MLSLNARPSDRADATLPDGAVDNATRRWQNAQCNFLNAVSPTQRESVERLLNQLHSGGMGLRMWLQAIAWRGAKLPQSIPVELIDVYLHDSEAVPLHDCEECGLAVPVRPNRLRGCDADPERTYFPCCPSCGGRTGWYLYWSHLAEPERHSETLAKRKPR